MPRINHIDQQAQHFIYLALKYLTGFDVGINKNEQEGLAPHEVAAPTKIQQVNVHQKSCHQNSKS